MDFELRCLPALLEARRLLAVPATLASPHATFARALSLARSLSLSLSLGRRRARERERGAWFSVKNRAREAAQPSSREKTRTREAAESLPLVRPDRAGGCDRGRELPRVHRALQHALPERRRRVVALELQGARRRHLLRNRHALRPRGPRTPQEPLFPNRSAYKFVTASQRAAPTLGAVSPPSSAVLTPPLCREQRRRPVTMTTTTTTTTTSSERERESGPFREHLTAKGISLSLKKINTRGGGERRSI